MGKTLLFEWVGLLAAASKSLLFESDTHSEVRLGPQALRSGCMLEPGRTISQVELQPGELRPCGSRLKKIASLAHFQEF